ncbi:MAG: nucleotidyltransferase domain-containing protein [Victivallales bacterium]
MTDTGLSTADIEVLCTVFKRHKEIRRVILFGSRAKGTARENSDIDLAIDGIDDELQIENLAMRLDDLPLPYKFDVKALNNIRNPKLKEHIARAGVVIFP